MLRFLPIILLIIAWGCKSVPKTKLSQSRVELNYKSYGDTLEIYIENVLHCPIGIVARSSDDSVKALTQNNFPIYLAPFTDTAFYYNTQLTKDDFKGAFSMSFGNPQDSVTPEALFIPFPQGKRYKIIQGYNGSFTHKGPYSQYALDFNLAVGDTITAAADGYVIGVIEGYKDGGKSKKWRDYANFITLFHPEMGIYTQYVHLEHEGSLVELGDTVTVNQPIGIVGMTGLTTTPHLHFNVLKSTEKGMVSMPVEFRGGISGFDLKSGIWVNRKPADSPELN